MRRIDGANLRHLPDSVNYGFLSLLQLDVFGFGLFQDGDLGQDRHMGDSELARLGLLACVLVET